MVNRGALMLRYKQPAVDWIVENDPYDNVEPVTIEHVNEERTVYLITDDEAESCKEWVADNFKALIEYELAEFYPDDDILPDLTLEQFYQWFDVEVHSVVVDTVQDIRLEDDEEF